jgi:hypothetical protein
LDVVEHATSGSVINGEVAKLAKKKADLLVINCSWKADLLSVCLLLLAEEERVWGL